MMRTPLRTPARFAPLALAAVLALGACGSDDTAGEQVPAVTEDDTGGSAGDALLAPRPIEVAGSGGTRMSAEAAGAPAAMDQSVATDMIAPYPYRVTTFVAGEGLPALPTNDVGYVFEIGQQVTAEQAVALAAALGVAGDPVQVDDGFGSWRVGPDDGSAPSLWIGGDAQLSWSYSSAWADQDVSVGGCAVAPSPEVGSGEIAVEPAIDPATSPATSDVVCATPEPPEDVPTAEQAETLTRDLLTALGEDPAVYEFEAYGDEWYASVNAVEQLDGSFPGRTVSTGFGPEGVMQYAGGQLAEPVRVGPYPLIDLDTALARLNDPSGFYGGGGMVALDSSVARGAADEPVAIDIAEAPPSEPATDVPISIPAPEEVTVTLVDVQPDVWWAWDVDGSAWIVPAYRFIGDDGGWYTVPAVTDDFLVQPPVDVPVTTPVDVPVTEPAPLPDDPGVPPSTIAPAGTPAELEALIGLPLDQFTAAASDLGYTVRVVYNDETGSLAGTDDFVETRINVHTRAQDGVETVYLIANLG